MDRLNLLGVETSSPVFSVAWMKAGHLASFIQANGQGPPSLLLTDLIRQASKQAQMDLEDLDGLAISIGPGSFTGLRVGVMTVKTLAWALKKPVVPISSLEVMASNIQDWEGMIMAFVDARKGKVYSALFACSIGQPIRRLTPDRLLLPDQAVAWTLKEDAHLLVLGDGLARYRSLLDPICSNQPHRIRLAEPHLWIPRADRLCQLAQAHWSMDRMDDPHRLVPQYLYSKESDITGW